MEGAPPTPERGSIDFVDRWFPVVLTTIRGAVGSAEAIAYCDWIDAMVDRAATEGTRIVSITDIVELRRPGLDLVRLATGRANERNARHPDRTLGGVVVVQSAVLRGVVAASIRMVHLRRHVTTVGNLLDAIARARMMLVTEGEPVPPDLEALARCSPRRAS